MIGMQEIVVSEVVLLLRNQFVTWVFVVFCVKIMSTVIVRSSQARLISMRLKPHSDCVTVGATILRYRGVLSSSPLTDNWNKAVSVAITSGVDDPAGCNRHRLKESARFWNNPDKKAHENLASAELPADNAERISPRVPQ